MAGRGTGRARAVAIGLWLWAATASGQTPYVRHLTTRDGLVQTSVSALAEDARGVVWLGTEAGLSRFDGATFDNYDAKTGFTNEAVRAIAVAGDEVYTLSSRGGVFRWRGGRPERLERPAPEHLFVDAGGRIQLVYPDHVATLDGERVPADPHPPLSTEDNALSARVGDRLYLSFRDRLLEFDGRRLSLLETYPALVEGLSPTPEAAPRLAVAVGARVLVRDAGGRTQTLFELAPGDRSSCLVRNRDELTLVARSGGVWRWTPTRTRTIRSGLPKNACLASLADRQGGLWIGLDSGGALYLPRTAFESFTERDGVGTGDVFFLEPEPSGGVWVGTRNGGIAYVDDADRVTSIRAADGLSSDKVRAMRLAAGALFVGTDEGLDRVERGKAPVRLASGAAFADLQLTPAGGVLAGAGDGRVLRVSPSGALELVGRVPTGVIVSAIDGDRIYVGAERGLFAIDGGRVAPEGPFAEREVRDVLVTQGRVFVLTDQEGVWRRDGERWTQLLPSDRPILRRGKLAPDGAVVFGGRTGLYRLLGDRFTKLDSTSGLASDVVYTFGFMPDGRLWVGGGAGLDLVERDRVVRHFDFKDGMADNELNNFEVELDARGRVWFATMAGAARIDPAVLAEPLPVPEVFVERVSRDGELLPMIDAPIEVGPEHTSLAIRFSAPYYKDPSRLSFQYGLFGFDPDYNEPVRDKSVVYRRLPPGRFEFRVRASLGGEWSRPATLPVVVRPRFHQTWWFRAVAGLAAVGLVWLAIGLRLRSVRRRNAELEALVTQRTAELERANRELAEMATTDALTGLHNRRFFQQKVEEDVAFAMRKARGRAGESAGPPTLGFLLVDVDHFKSVNDRDGHAAGDALLTEIARRLGATVRSSDTLVRWGGEEFLVMSRENDFERAGTLAERLRRAAMEQPFQLKSRTIERTVSVGYSVFPAGPGTADVTWEDVVSLADQGLYLAKRTGRNRVVGVRISAPSLGPAELALVRDDLPKAVAAGLVEVVGVERKAIERRPSEPSPERRPSVPGSRHADARPDDPPVEG